MPNPPRLKDATAEYLASKLNGRRRGNTWMARCPAHVDRTPSLAITEGRNCVVFRCHAQCDQSAIIAALLAQSIISAERRSDHAAASATANIPRARPSTRPRAATTLPEAPCALTDLIRPDGTYKIFHDAYGFPDRVWKYLSAAGGIAGYVCRFDFPGGKEVLPLSPVQHRDGRFAWHWTGFAVPRPLYNLPAITQHKDLPVLVGEGEKVADAAQRLFPAMIPTTPPGGGKAAHQADWSVLRHRHVYAIGDHDRAGHSFLARIAEEGRAAPFASLTLVHWPIQLVVAHDAPTGPRAVSRPQPIPPGWDIADAADDGWDESTVHLLEKHLQYSHVVYL